MTVPQMSVSFSLQPKEETELSPGFSLSENLFSSSTSNYCWKGKYIPRDIVKKDQSYFAETVKRIPGASLALGLLVL